MLSVSNLPSSGRVSFLKQETKNRYIAHVLYTVPISRGDVMVVEDFLPVPVVEIEVKVPEIQLCIPELWMSDGPHGIRFEIEWDSWNTANFTNDSCTAFPALTCLASTWNPELSRLYGKSIGAEGRYRKKDVLLGPGVNIYRVPLNGRNFEYMGEDPYLSSRMVVPFVIGVQENGVAAYVKHFALNNHEKWRMSINVELSDRALHASCGHSPKPAPG